MNFIEKYKQAQTRRLTIATWTSFIGLSFALFFAFTHSELYWVKATIKSVVAIPIAILIPRELFRFKSKSLIYKISLLFMGSIFISLFIGDEQITSKAVMNLFRRCFYIISCLIAAPLAMPLFRKYKKPLSGLLLIASAFAIYPLFHFATTPNLTRLIKLAPDLDANTTGWIYVILSGFILNTCPKKASLKWILPCLLSLIVLFSAIMLTASRTSILGMLGLLGVFLVFSRDRRLVMALFALIVSAGVYWHGGKISQPSQTVRQKVATTSVSAPSAPNPKEIEKKTPTPEPVPIAQKKAILTAQQSTPVKPNASIIRGAPYRPQIWSALLERMEGLEKLSGRGHLSFAGHAEFSIPHCMYLATYYHAGILALLLHISLTILLLILGFRAAKTGFLLPLSLLAICLPANLFDGAGILHGVSSMLLIWPTICAALCFNSKTTQNQD